MQIDREGSQAVYWAMMLMPLVPFVYGWAGLSAIQFDKHEKEAWWGIGRFAGRNS